MLSMLYLKQFVAGYGHQNVVVDVCDVIPSDKRNEERSEQRM